MNRREFMGATVLAGATAVLAGSGEASEVFHHPSFENEHGEAPANWEPIRDDGAFDLQRSTLVVDGLDVSVLDENYIRMMKAGGVNCWHKSLGDIRSFALTYNFLDLHKDEIVTATTVAEIRQAHAQGKIATVFGWQSADTLETEIMGNPLAGSAIALRGYYQLGIRIVGIAYNAANLYGGGCLEPQIGLTRAGRRLVEEIHKLNIILDVAGHTGEQASFDAIAMSSGVPIICSHTNVAALNKNLRCTSDRLIEAIASTGGVIGLTTFNDFHARTPKDANVKSTPQVGLEKHLDQYDYLRKLVGADHIGFGPDFVEGRQLTYMNYDVLPREAYSDLPWFYVKGIEKVSELPNLTRGLMERGWADADIRKVLGENWLRVYQQVWGS